MASLKPPFTKETATAKLKFAQAMWNTKDPEKVSRAYTPDCIWRNRGEFIQGTEQIRSFLREKWRREQDYRLRKELFCVGGDEGEKIAVQFWYEYRDRDDGMRWKRCYGLEDWTFDRDGKMKKRMMSGNDVLLGVDGNGVGDETDVKENREGKGNETGLGLGKQGRWFLDGVDVDDDRVTKLITDRHY